MSQCNRSSLSQSLFTGFNVFHTNKALSSFAEITRMLKKMFIECFSEFIRFLPAQQQTKLSLFFKETLGIQSTGSQFFVSVKIKKPE